LLFLHIPSPFLAPPLLAIFPHPFYHLHSHKLHPSSSPQLICGLATTCRYYYPLPPHPSFSFPFPNTTLYLRNKQTHKKSTLHLLPSWTRFLFFFDSVFTSLRRRSVCLSTSFRSFALTFAPSQSTHSHSFIRSFSFPVQRL
jgi:hypothetical protein